MMNTVFQTISLIIGGFMLLIWNQPDTLLRVTGWLECWCSWFIRELRIRAWSKAAAMQTYRSAQVFHRASKSGGDR